MLKGQRVYFCPELLVSILHNYIQEEALGVHFVNA